MALRRFAVTVILVLFTCLFSNKLHAQASWEPFGQNRIQYRTFEWMYFDSTHFRVFYYGTGKAHAMYSISVAEQRYHIQKRFK